MSFVRRYGPWALVAGASEGVGSAFAVEVARRGVNVVLLARRQGVLDEVADTIRSESGVEVRTVAVDLATPGAARRVLDATSGLEVGLLMYNAGADTSSASFLGRPIEDVMGMVQRNCAVPTQLCHHYAAGMVARGRGGIIVVSSGAALAGAPYLVPYGATKAFDMIFAEGLWAELHDLGIDVLSLVLGETDTPALRRIRKDLGHDDAPDAPIPGATSADQVVVEALEHLPQGPSWMTDEGLRAGHRLIGSLSRAEAVDLMTKAGQATMGYENEGSS